MKVLVRTKTSSLVRLYIDYLRLYFREVNFVDITNSSQFNFSKLKIKELIRFLHMCQEETLAH